MPEHGVVVQVSIGVKHGALAERFFAEGPANEVGSSVGAGSMSG